MRLISSLDQLIAVATILAAIDAVKNEPESVCLLVQDGHKALMNILGDFSYLIYDTDQEGNTCHLH
jgi:hypothetical protein